MTKGAAEAGGALPASARSPDAAAAAEQDTAEVPAVEPGGRVVPVGSADPTAANAGARPAAIALLGATALAACAADLATKQLAIAELAGEEPVRLLGGGLYLTLTYNSGAAFSIGRGYTAIFPVITVVVVAGIIWLARRLRSLPWAAAMGLILGGALGNLVDRLFRAPGPFRGHVVDFLSVFDEAGRVFPIFNLADTALFCGVVLAMALELSGRRRDGRRVRKSKVRHSTGGAD